MIHWWGDLRPYLTKAALSGFFVARPVRAFSRLEHRLRKEQIKLDIVKAVIKIVTTLIVQLIRHFF